MRLTRIENRWISGGTLDFASTFSQTVSFGATGILELAQSQTYSGTIYGFSKTDQTSLDLRDIAFVSAGEATFSGTAAGGMLTVTDGTHTAHIKLAGNYLGSSFTASSDGHGGTTVVDPLNAAASQQRFVAAAASFGATTPGQSIGTLESYHSSHPHLVAPRMQFA